MLQKRYKQNFSVVGGSGIILNNDYDPKQGWFDFMSGSIITHTFIQQNKTPPYVPSRDSYSKIVVDQKYQIMYKHNHYGQLCLPFKEFKKIDKLEFDNVEHHLKYIGCDLDENGDPYFGPIRELNDRELSKWLSNNCKGRYKKTAKRIWFEKKDDALLFKLSKHSLT